MDKLLEQALLYDFYGELLTEHRREIYQCYLFENLSLGEIAQQEGISRQAVHDVLKKCDKTLAEYEDKLHLVARFSDAKDKLENILALIDELGQDNLDEKRAKLSELTGSLLEDF